VPTLKHKETHISDPVLHLKLLEKQAEPKTNREK
jgi:hypothetical protein